MTRPTRPSWILLIAALAGWVIPCCTPAQSLLNPGDIPGISITRTRSFNGSSLWGYIDGGADIYLEYGFDKVTALDIQADSTHCIADFYLMKSPDAAFGIFSIHRRNCPPDSLTEYACVDAHQIQFARGRYYISITNEHGSAAEQRLCRSIGMLLVSRIPAESIRAPSLFRTLAPREYQYSLRLIHGPLGIQNGALEFDSWFTDLDNFNLWTMDAGTSAKIAYVQFDSAAGRNLFYHQMGIDTLMWRSVPPNPFGGGSVDIFRDPPAGAYLLQSGAEGWYSKLFHSLLDTLKHRAEKKF